MLFRPTTRPVNRAVSALIAIFLALGSGMPIFAQQKPKTLEEDPEVKLGRENAAENDRQVKLIGDAAILERVNRIGQEIAAVANTTPVPATWGSSEVKKFNYTFKVVDDKDVNAYSLPGGFIYVNKGTLDYVKSDDELAGVLAHEVAHASHHHMMKLIREQNKMQPFLALLLIAATLGKSGGGDVGALAIAGQLYMVAKLNSYGIEAEKDADQAAVHYLRKTKYSPVGLLTFMERLARDESIGPERHLGIYRTHPPSPERARSLLAQLESMKIAIRRRTTDPSLGAKVSPLTVNGVAMAEVKVGKLTVATFGSAGGKTADERARKFSADLDALLDQDLQMYEVHLNSTQTGVIARTQLLAAYTAADLTKGSATVEGLAQSTVAAIRNVLWQAQFNRVPASASSK